jgi:hypothetical protein
MRKKQLFMRAAIGVRNVILAAVLTATSLVYAGCSSSGDGGGGGTGGGMTPLSFNAETALPAAGGAAIATAFGTRFASITSSIFDALSSGDGAASFGARPKVNLPICQTGTADLDGALVADTTVTLTLTNCAGSLLSSTEANGRIELFITNVGGGGGIIDAIASFAGLGDEDVFTIAPDTALTGSFAVSANFSPSSPLLNLSLGLGLDGDWITVSEAGRELQLGCFGMDTRIGLLTGAFEFLRPRGVVRLDNQVYTLNSYTEGVPNIGFESTGTGVPDSGSILLLSGDRRPCPRFAGTPEGDDSRATATFMPGGNVTIDVDGAAADCFLCTTTWENLLDTLSQISPDTCEPVSCGGSGGAGGAPTGATPSPVECPVGADIEASADAFIRGGPHADTSYGEEGRLVVKGVAQLEFARKFYIVFDLSTAPAGLNKASLILTLNSHVGRTPVNMYGIVDNNDWDPSDPAENAITWNNAPRNNTAAGNMFEVSEGVRLLVDRYDFDLPDAEDPDPDGTQYSLDVTDYVMWALGDKPDFNNAAPGGDEDGQISLLFAIPGLDVVDGSSFKSRDIPVGEMCARPFLHFESP